MLAFQSVRATFSGFIILTMTAWNAPHALGQDRQVIAKGMENPESVAIGPDGRLYMTVIGKDGVDGDGTLAVIEDGKPKTFAKGLDDPKGLIVHGGDFYVADKTRVWKIDATGKATVFAKAADFPVKPIYFNDIAVGPDGDLYVSDCGTFEAHGAVFRIKPSKEIVVVLDQKIAPALKAPNGLLPDGKDHLLVADFTAGVLYRLKISDGKLVELAKGMGGADGIAKDAKGRIYVSDWKKGRMFLVTEDVDKPKLLYDDFKAAADLIFDAKGGEFLIPDMKAGTLSTFPAAK